jgi:hypothetical protein
MGNPLQGDITIPKVGSLPKKVVVPLAVGVAGFIVWRFWQARSAPAATTDATITDGEFGAVDSSIPDTLNPFPSSFSSGSSSTGSSSGADTNGDGTIGPGEFTNNGQWTAYVTDRIPTDTWSQTDIVTALGLGLAGKPTTDTQQSILRAAVAIGGPPPQGSITYVSGGNTDLTVAPGAPSVAATETTAVVSFSGVAGATSYQVFRTGMVGAAATGSGSPITVEGLLPNHTYGFTVAGVTSSGKVGPKSAAASATTKAYTMGKPPAPSISAVTTTTATARVAAVAHADEFYWYLNGKMAGSTQGMQWAITGLKPKTKYTVAAQARGFNQPAGPTGPATSFTTK